MKKILCFIFAILFMFPIFFNFNNSLEVTALNNDLTAKSYIVIDSNGRVLQEHNPDEKREVASICKLMTTLITLEEIEKGKLSLDDNVTASKYACDAEGSQAFLDAGSEYLVRDLIKSVIVASANDSAIVLAETIGGSEESFVDLMNKKALELGMNNTLYANSTGLPANNQYSTAYDTAILLNKISMYDLYKKDCKIWMDTLTHPSGRKTELVNTNRLIKYYPNCVTGKTGFTDEAGYCLSSTAIKNDLKLTCVVLGCKNASDRFTDSVTLYNKTFADYKSEKVIDKSIIIENGVKVLKGKTDTINVVAENDYYLTLSKINPEQFDLEYVLIEDIKAPIEVGDVVGRVNVWSNGELVETINLISVDSIERESYKDVLEKISENFSLIR